MTTRRLAPGSLVDTDWQLAEYERVMGEEAAARQAKAAKLERGECICKRRTVKLKGLFYTLHEKGDCPKYKPWMDNVRSEVADQQAALRQQVDDSRHGV